MTTVTPQFWGTWFTNYQPFNYNSSALSAVQISFWSALLLNFWVHLGVFWTSISVLQWVSRDPLHFSGGWGYLSFLSREKSVLLSFLQRLTGVWWFLVWLTCIHLWFPVQFRKVHAFQSINSVCLLIISLFMLDALCWVGRSIRISFEFYFIFKLLHFLFAWLLPWVLKAILGSFLFFIQKKQCFY